ncbi:MAG: sulfite exporter TauE/SafE family protein [Alphaproteobacteria bacterium]|nr:sulfite exporter TauE/SafE family protein [Alphaproteobacteria bacterium]
MLVDAVLPASLSVFHVLFLVAASFLTSLITASVGIGGGTIMIALMSYILPVSALIPVHGCVQLGSNAGRVLVMRRHVEWARLAAFSLGAIIGASAGAAIAVRLSSGVVLTGLGLFVLLSTWIKIPKLVSIRQGGMALIGATTTFLSMFFGATAPLNAALLSNSFSERQTLVGSLAAITSAQHGFKIIGFALAGFVFAPWLPLVAMMIVFGFAGTLVGARILLRLPEERFRLIFKIVLTVLAVEMFFRGIGTFFPDST